jgi:hypothetical protein
MKSLTSFKLEGSRWRLWKETEPRTGDSGGLLESLTVEDDKVVHYPAEVRVGCRVRCGSVYARTMQSQDWWMTSLVQEILEATPQRVRFRTLNSIYIVEAG